MAWDHDVLQAEIDRSVGDYAAKVAEGQVTVEHEFLTAVMCVDGTLRELLVDPRALRRLGADGLAEAMTETIKMAEHEAAAEREALAGRVTFFGHPLFETVQEMITNPEAAVRRLIAGADERR